MKSWSRGHEDHGTPLSHQTPARTHTHSSPSLSCFALSLNRFACPCSLTALLFPSELILCPSRRPRLASLAAATFVALALFTFAAACRLSLFVAFCSQPRPFSVCHASQFSFRLSPSRPSVAPGHGLPAMFASCSVVDRVPYSLPDLPSSKSFQV